MSIEKILSEVVENEESDFGVKLTAESSGLLLEVKDVGEIKFPMKASQVKSLIKNAKKAPFGYKDKTLIDLSIRNVWEIKKSKLKINKRLWNKTLHPILANVQKSLNLPSGKVIAELDKLLIYEKGQFFAPHQDSEKKDNMLATLVVLLPCKHEGGSLIVSHQGKSKKFKALKKDVEKLNFFSFYSDCHHEIKKVTSGYRVALSYNLMVEADGKIINKEYTKEFELLKNSLKIHFKEKQKGYSWHEIEENKKFVYFFDHEYTQRGLSVNTVKGLDGVRLRLLQEVANHLELKVFLCLAEIHEVWSCKERHDGGYHRRKFRGWYDEDELEEEPENLESEYDLEELIDESNILSFWKSLDGEVLDYGRMFNYSDEMFFTKNNDELTPTSSEYEGWMGNYGNTLDRWYRRGALVLWPKSAHFQGVSGVGTNYALSVINEAIKSSNKVELSEAIGCWIKVSKRLEMDKNLFYRALKTAMDVKSKKLAREIMKPFSILFFDASFIDKFLSLADVYGEQWCFNILKVWHEGVDFDKLIDSNIYLLDFVNRVNGAFSKNQKKWTKALSIILEENVKALVKKNKRNKEFYSKAELDSKFKDRVRELSFLLLICAKLGDTLSEGKLLKLIMSDIELFPDETVFQVLLALSKDKINKNSVKSLSKYLKIVLEKEIKKGLRSRDDWSLKAKIKCDCQDCMVVNTFFKNREDNVIELPIAKRRRQHLHHEIEHLGVYVSHKTRRKGSPYTLVLEKLPLIFESEEKLLTTRKKMLGNLKKFKLGGGVLEELKIELFDKF